MLDIRFIGLVMVLAGAGTIYFLGYRGMTVDQARSRLATLLNLPGLAPPVASSAPTATPPIGSVAV